MCVCDLASVCVYVSVWEPVCVSVKEYLSYLCVYQYGAGTGFILFLWRCPFKKNSKFFIIIIWERKKNSLFFCGMDILYKKCICAWLMSWQVGNQNQNYFGHRKTLFAYFFQCVSVSLSLRLSVCRIFTSVILFAGPSVRLLTVWPTVCLPLDLSTCLSALEHVCLCLYSCLFFCVSVCVSVCLRTGISFVCLFVICHSSVITCFRTYASCMPSMPLCLYLVSFSVCLSECFFVFTTVCKQFARLAFANLKVKYFGEIEESKSYSKRLQVINQGTRWVRFMKKTRGWKPRETITFREPQFSFKLCCQNCVRAKILPRLQS